MTQNHPTKLESPPPSTIEPEPQESRTRPKPLHRAFNPLDYRIHIGWFGGIHIYSKSQNHEHC